MTAHTGPQQRYAATMRGLVANASFLLTATLAGCGFADSHSFLPSALRAPEPAARQPEPEPDVHALVQSELAGLFMDGAHPSNIRVSPPQPGVVGLTWIACIKANITGMTGNPIGIHTVMIEMTGGKIRSRRRADDNGICAQVPYEPL